MFARGRLSGIKFWSDIKNGSEKESELVLVFDLIYLLGCLYFFDSIIMWMGGDALGHASIISYLLDGSSVPVSVYPFGAKWDYYPKAFHMYSFFWASLLPIGVVRLIQAVPVIVTTVTSLLVYSVVRESGKREIALYAFVIACFCFIQHSSYLIWAGYPAATAEMLLLLIGGVSTGVVFKSYVDSWALPEADYRAMVWMNEQRFENAICINLDTVGRWIYPLTGIPVSNPRSVPRLDVTREGQVIGYPNEPKTVEMLYNDSLRYEHVLLYVSNVANTRPGHKPPFSRFNEHYPSVNVSNFNATFYDLVYAKDNAYVFYINMSDSKNRCSFLRDIFVGFDI